jgi:hypothetical protein
MTDEQIIEATHKANLIMSQFDLFAGPAAASAPAEPKPARVRPVIAQPPAIIMEGQPVGEHPAGLRPLRVFHADWLEVKVSDAEFNAARRPPTNF